MLLTSGDIAAAAAAMGQAEGEWIDQYTGLARNRAQLTLKSRAGGECVLLNADSRCRIYEARPKQCRDFPHNWQVEGCPGCESSRGECRSQNSEVGMS